MKLVKLPFYSIPAASSRFSFFCLRKLSSFHAWKLRSHLGRELHLFTLLIMNEFNERRLISDIQSPIVRPQMAAVACPCSEDTTTTTDSINIPFVLIPWALISRFLYLHLSPAYSLSRHPTLSRIITPLPLKLFLSGTVKLWRQHLCFSIHFQSFCPKKRDQQIDFHLNVHHISPSSI